MRLRPDSQSGPNKGINSGRAQTLALALKKKVPKLQIRGSGYPQRLEVYERTGRG